MTYTIDGKISKKKKRYGCGLQGRKGGGVICNYMYNMLLWD